MHGIPEAQAGMTAKHDTRLPVLGVHYLILAIKTDTVHFLLLISNVLRQEKALELKKIHPSH
jgi:hypothetical protein